MGNAAKFIESGEIELSIALEDKKDNQVKLHTTVRDTGVGIPEDKLNSIFEPFQQADGSITRKYGGTGLGLSICRKISRHMKGDVWAESSANSMPDQEKQSTDTAGQPGSVFHFTAWLDESEEKVTEKIRPVSVAGKKVMIIDDNTTNLELLQRILEFAGMQVEALSNGPEVVEKLSRAAETGSPFDILISDLQMPAMSGYDIARQVRNADPAISGIPLLALSSTTDRDRTPMPGGGIQCIFNQTDLSQKTVSDAGAADR